MRCLDKRVLDAIICLISGYKQVDKIVIFGSRARSDCSMKSDIDIAVFGNAISDTDVNIIKHRLEEEIKTILKFDVVNFNTIEKNSLRDNILKQGKVIYERSKD